MLVCLISSGCKESILHDLSEYDANRLVTHLNSVAIEAGKTKQPDGRWALEVNETDSIRALQVLDENRLLRAATTAPERASLTASREEQRFHYERGLSREIEATLASIDGVLEARVHLNLPAVDPLFGTPIKNSPSSASVLLLASPKVAITRESVGALVSGASGIDAAHISVLISAPIDERPGSRIIAPVVELKEDQWIPGLTKRLLLQIGSWTLVLAVAVGLFVVLPRRKQSKAFNPFVRAEA